MGINAFAIAMRKIKPDAQVKVVWVNSWYDPGKEGDAAKALLDRMPSPTEEEARQALSGVGGLLSGIGRMSEELARLGTRRI